MAYERRSIIPGFSKIIPKDNIDPEPKVLIEENTRTKPRVSQEAIEFMRKLRSRK